MSSTVRKLLDKGLISPPKFIADNVMYEVMMGSIAYGVSNDASDVDVYGFCIPPKDMVFPHLAGEILGFGQQIQRFEQYQQHHIKCADESKGYAREYDLTIYSIVKYFDLCMQNNPNMIDSLFVPDNCVLHITKIGNMVKDKRQIFLHKGSWHKFKGYAYSQMHKMKSQNRTGKRQEIVAEFGYDVKFAYHVVRLLNEVEQILTEENLDLQRNREQLKSIRRGEWKLEDIENYFQEKEKLLETAYANSKLPHTPDQDKIKKLLVDCLEEYYGSLSKCLVIPGRQEKALREIVDIAKKALE